ncbi:MAG: DUF2589 domain-containing protein [Acetobacteraceae bacterium]|nr:DUF2589 domain-containing protein [Acetobacteraceae bacterium]
MSNGAPPQIPLGQELASLDFENLIGGPLVAAVHAQTQAAMATVDFIKQVGFKAPASTDRQNPREQITGEPATCTFKYKKTFPKTDGTVEEKSCELTVPFLTILPIPSLRIEEFKLHFLAKLHSIQYSETISNLNVTASADASFSYFWVTARLKASASYQRNTREGFRVTRDYSLDVNVRAVQDEMPAGMEKMLSILQGLILEKAT